MDVLPCSNNYSWQWLSLNCSFPNVSTPVLYLVKNSLLYKTTYTLLADDWQNKEIREAMDVFEAHTCLTFKKRTAQTEYIEIKDGPG